MKCNLLICAQNIITDKNTNQISIINIYEAVKVSNLPFLLPLSILISTEREVEEPSNLNYNLEILINETRLFTHPITIDYLGQKKNNAAVNLQGLIIPAIGDLLFKVIFNGDEVRRTTINIQNPT